VNSDLEFAIEHTYQYAYAYLIFILDFGPDSPEQISPVRRKFKVNRACVYATLKIFPTLVVFVLRMCYIYARVLMHGATA